MTKFPERIKIASKRYTIQLCGEESSLPEDDDGQCDFGNQKILVREGMPSDLTKETLLHEIFHGIEDEWDLVELTEEHIKGLSKGLLSVLMDNPSFARYLLRKA